MRTIIFAPFVILSGVIGGLLAYHLGYFGIALAIPTGFIIGLVGGAVRSKYARVEQ